MMGLSQYLRSYEINERIISDQNEPITNRIRAIGDMLASAVRDNLRTDLLHMRACLIAEAEQS